MPRYNVLNRFNQTWFFLTLEKGNFYSLSKESKKTRKYLTLKMFHGRKAIKQMTRKVNQLVSANETHVVKERHIVFQAWWK